MTEEGVFTRCREKRRSLTRKKKIARTLWKKRGGNLNPSGARGKGNDKEPPAREKGTLDFTGVG